MPLGCHIHHLNPIHRVLRRVSVVPVADAANTKTRVVSDADQIRETNTPKPWKRHDSVAAVLSRYQNLRMEPEHTGWVFKALNDLLSFSHSCTSLQITLRVHPFPSSAAPIPLNPQMPTPSPLLSCCSTGPGPRSCPSPTRSPNHLRHRGSRHSPLANVALPTLACCRPPLVSSPSCSPLLVSYFSACPSLRLYHFELIFLFIYSFCSAPGNDTMQTPHPSLVFRHTHKHPFLVHFLCSPSVSCRQYVISF